jgi:hypothetical protein
VRAGVHASAFRTAQHSNAISQVSFVKFRRATVIVTEAAITLKSLSMAMHFRLVRPARLPYHLKAISRLAPIDDGEANAKQ